MKKICWILGIVVLFGSTFAQKGLAEYQIFERTLTRAGQEYVPGEIIVKFIPGTREDVIANLNSKHGTSVLSTSRFAGFKRLRIPRGRTLAQMVEVYKRNPNVEYAELNHIAHALWAPNDPLYSYQWHLDNADYGGINMESAWDIATGDLSVIVAVIDTGVAYENYEEFVDNPGRGKDYWITYQLAPDLANTSFVAGYDFVNNDTHSNDDEGHGTHVTGTIAQNTNNNVGVAGVAFDCSIMPVKVLDSGGSGTYADIADGIYFAADNGAKVINMSLGGSSDSITLENAVAYAYGEGVTIVCSSGNNGSATTVGYPAAYDAYCIAVGATRYDEAVASYSNGGASLDLTAPGGDLNVDQNGDDYGDGVLQQTFGSNPTDWGYWFYHGTSMAAPHAAGVAALLIADGVATTPDEVREALQSTAEDKGAPGWDSEYGWGIVDAFAALNWIAGPVDNPPAVSITNPADGSAFDSGATIAFQGTANDTEDGDLTASLIWTSNSDGQIGTEGSFSTTLSDGTHTITASVTDSGGKTGSDSISITVIVPGAAMHVDSIEMSLSERTAGRNVFTKAVATVTIVDASGNPVEGATVYGTWSDATSDIDSGVTDSFGEVTLSSDGAKNASSGTIFTFTVDNVVKSGWDYDSAANIKTSNKITVP